MLHNKTEKKHSATKTKVTALAVVEVFDVMCSCVVAIVVIVVAVVIIVKIDVVPSSSSSSATTASTTSVYACSFLCCFLCDFFIFMYLQHYVATIYNNMKLVCCNVLFDFLHKQKQF